MSSPYSPPETATLDSAPAVRPQPLVAVLLTTFAGGAGYYYAGARWRLVAYAVVAPVWLVCVALSVRAGLPPWILALYALFTPLVMLDTFLQSRRSDARRPPWPELGGVIVLCFVYFGAVSWVFRAFVMEPFHVPAASMAPALLPGDYFFSDNLAYVIGEPERGDIATFRFPDDRSVMFVKRIVGIPGDVVELTPEGEVVVNGARLPLQSAGSYTSQGDEFSLLREENPPDRSHFILRRSLARYQAGVGQSFEVPEGAYFVLGDNRDNSKDSRRWNHSYVPREDLRGRAVYIHWSSDPETGEVRYERLGRLGERVDLPAETPAAAGP